jgi:hypothetical protein
MKKVGELMKDMGFNPNSSDSAKEAFVKYLIKQSTGTSVITPTEKKIIQDNPQKIVSFSKQLEFDFDEGQTETRKKA